MKKKIIIILFLFTINLIAKKNNNMEFINLVVKPNILKSHVSFLINTPNSRNWEHPNSLEIAYNYIKNNFEKSGLDIQEQIFNVHGKIYKNIIGIVNPHKEKILVVGAHYDVCGDQQGADDNASGVSGLIELGRLAKENQKHIEYQIQFVGFANEEPPFFGTSNMGSYQHAKLLYEKNKEVSLMIALEMIGYYTDKKKSQSYPSFLLKPFYPSKGNFIAVISNHGSRKFKRKVRNAINDFSDIRARSLTAPNWVTGVDFSDHRNYWIFGYKAVMITDTAFFRNKNYHQPSDTIETLNFDKMAEVVKGIGYYFFSH